MKHPYLLLAALFVSAPAYAINQDLYVCMKKEGTLVHFKVDGKKASIKIGSVVEEFKVTEEFSAKTEEDLKEFKNVIGEKATSAVGYALKGKIETGAWVVQGRSTSTYLVEAGMEILLVGSDKSCRRSLTDIPSNSTNSSSEAAMLLIEILRQGR